MPLVKNVNTQVTDGGGGTKTYNNGVKNANARVPKQTTPTVSSPKKSLFDSQHKINTPKTSTYSQPTGVYGSQYGGVSTRNVSTSTPKQKKSDNEPNNNVYGSNYGGASTGSDTPKGSSKITKDTKINAPAKLNLNPENKQNPNKGKISQPAQYSGSQYDGASENVNNTPVVQEKPEIKTRADFGSDSDYENYLLDNRIDTTRGDAFDYIKSKADEKGILARQYLEEMRVKNKNLAGTTNIRNKIENGEVDSKVAERWNEEVNSKYGVIVDNDGNEIDPSKYAADIEFVNNTAIDINSRLETLYKKFQSGKIDYAMYQKEAARLTNLFNQNAARGDELNSYKILQGFDYYDWAKENGKDVSDFEAYVESMDDGIVERLAEMAAASWIDTVNIPVQTLDIIHTIFDPNYDFTDENSISSQLTNNANQVREYALGGADGFTKWTTQCVGSLMPMINTMMVGSVFGLSGEALEGFTNIVLGTQSGAETVRQRLDQGATLPAALLNGVVHGIITGMVEARNMGDISKLITGDYVKYIAGVGLFSKVSPAVIARYLVQTGVGEGTEEIIESVADNLADTAQNFIFGGLMGDVNVDELDPKEIGNEFLMAAVGAVLLGGAAGQVNQVSNFVVNSKLRYNAAMAAKEHFNSVLADENAMESEKDLAKKCIDVIDFGMKATDYKSLSQLADAVDLDTDIVEPVASYEEMMNHLCNAMQLDVQDQIDSAMDTINHADNIRNNLQEALLERGINMPAEQFINASDKSRAAMLTLSKKFDDMGIKGAFARLLPWQNGKAVDDGIILNTNQTGSIKASSLANLDEKVYRDIMDKDVEQIFDEVGDDASYNSTAAHEITHFAERSGQWQNLRDIAVEMMGQEKFDTLQKRLGEIYEKYGERANTEHEAVAYFIQENLGNSEFLTRLASYNTSLFTRMFENAKALFSGNAKTKLENTFMKAVMDSKSVVDVSTPNGSVAPAQAGIGSFSDTDLKTLAEQIKDTLNKDKTPGSEDEVTIEQVNKWIDSVKGVAKMIADDVDRLGYVSNSTYSALKSNSDYEFTVDMSTLCKKRLLLQGTIDAIQRALPDTPLTSMDYILIRELMKKKGLEVSCGFCYVESARRHLGDIAKSFIEKTGYDVTIADLLTVDGVEKLQKTNPKIYEDFVKFNKKRGQARDMLVETRTEYRGEIRNLTEAKVAKLIAKGGLRLQSYSDFETPHLIDMMQVVLDMSAKGLTSQAYTKVPNFADAFGNTNIKINLSLVCKGLDEKGELIFDDVEGMPHEDAFRLREKYSKNVGTILVGKDDATILAAMADPRIDYIIPFHQSGWANAEFEALGITGYTDYTKFQHEKLINPIRYEITRGENKGQLGEPTRDPKGGDIQPLSYWDFTKTGRENAVKYLELCKEQGRVPKFYNFLVDNGDGSWSLQNDGSTDGYWKTLIDFKMYDNDGVGSPQEKVVPIFDDSVNQRILNEYNGEGKTLRAAEDVVQEFLNKKKQLDIVLSTNPRDPRLGNHTWIDVIGDIKTYAEAMGDSEAAYTPDFTEEDAERAIKSGTITVYSSKPISNGAFVTPSKMEARNYGENVYKKTVSLNDVAWIDTLQGQYTGGEGQLSIGKAAKDAVKEFGTTDNFMKAGYILGDGSLLDLSEGQNRRVQDHRVVGVVYDDLDYARDGMSAGLIRFMNEGNVRISPEIGGVDISRLAEPTSAQYRQIANFLRYYDTDWHTLDISDEDGSKVFGIEYPRFTPTSKIINDIRNYFEDGTIPENSYNDQYSIGGAKGLNNLQQNGTEEDIKKYEKAMQLREEARRMRAELNEDGTRKYTENQILEKTGWFIPEYENGSIRERFEFYDDDLIEKLIEYIKSTKGLHKGYKQIDVVKRQPTIGDIIGEDTLLLKMYPELKNVNLVIANRASSVAGFYNNFYKVLEVNKKSDIGTAWDEKQFRDTLAHEIQHFIQYYEGFTVRDYPKQSYLDRPGEKEAWSVGGKQADPTARQFDMFGDNMGLDAGQVLDQGEESPESVGDQNGQQESTPDNDGVLSVDTEDGEPGAASDSGEDSTEPTDGGDEQPVLGEPDPDDGGLDATGGEPPIKTKTSGGIDTPAQILDEMPEASTSKEKLQRAKWFAKFQIVDHLYAVRELARKLKNNKINAFADFAMLAQNIASQTLTKKRYKLHSNQVIGESLKDIINDVDTVEKKHILSEYLYHMRNIDHLTIKDRLGEDHENKKGVFGDSVGVDDSRARVQEILESDPWVEEKAKRLYEYLKQDRQLLVDSGVISKAMNDYLEKAYPHYVPIQRNLTGGSGVASTDPNRLFMKFKGSTIDLLPLFPTFDSKGRYQEGVLEKHTRNAYRTALSNDLHKEIMNTAKGFKEVNADDITESLDNGFNPLEENPKGKRMYAYVNGKKFSIPVSDELYDSLTPPKHPFNLPNIEPLRGVTEFRRNLITSWNPLFSLTNPLKDIQDALVNTKYLTKYPAKLAEAVAQVVPTIFGKEGGQMYQLYAHNGGGQNSYLSELVQDPTLEEKKSKSLFGMIKKTVKNGPLAKGLSKLIEINEAIETIPRLAEFMATLEDGKTLQEAMYNAAEVTTNFKRGGDLAKYINRNGAAFLNASIQGFDKQVRNLQDAKDAGVKGMLTYMAKITLLNGLPLWLINHLLWRDNKEYEELSDYVKNNYYIFPSNIEGKFIRIPKGRIAAFYQTVMQNGADTISGKTKLWDALLSDYESFMNNIAPNTVSENLITKPLFDAFGSPEGRTWYGDELIPTRLQNVPDSEQYDESTDALSIEIGKLSKKVADATGMKFLELSPYKINYVLDQYSGGVGDVVLPMMTQKTDVGINSPFWKGVASPFIDKFTTDPVLKNQNVADFYSMKDELYKLSNSRYATDEQILANKYMYAISNEMGELYARKREIQGDSSLTNKEKNDRVRAIQEQINELAKTGLANYDQIDITGRYATVGGVQYYKKDDGSWVKPSQSSIEKLADAGLSDADKDAYYQTFGDITSIREEIKAKTPEGQKADYSKATIDAISNSNLSAKGKNTLFDSYYDSDFTNHVNAMGLSDEDSYALKVANKMAEGQKDENGKTIANSKAEATARAYEELGLLDDVLKYIKDNNIEPKEMGLSKTVYNQLIGGASFTDSYSSAMSGKKSSKRSSSKSSGKSSKKPSSKGLSAGGGTVSYGKGKVATTRRSNQVASPKLARVTNNRFLNAYSTSMRRGSKDVSTGSNAQVVCPRCGNRVSSASGRCPVCGARL